MTSHPSELPRSPRHSDIRARTDFWLDIIVVIAAAGDALCFVGAMLLGFYGRKQLNSIADVNLIEFYNPLSSYAGHFVFGVLLFLALAGRTGMYSAHNLIKLRQIFIGAMNAVILWALFYVCLSLLFSIRPSISRLFVVFSAVCGFALVIYWRVLLRFLLNRNGILKRLRQRLVIVG